MGRFSEKTFKDWANTGGEHEQKEVAQTRKKIREGIKLHPNLQGKGIDIFVQGSYANDTNVKKGSDVDICVMLKFPFQSPPPAGYDSQNLERINIQDFRKWVNKAMIQQFGVNHVIQKNNSIQIRSKSASIQADVVPCFQYEKQIQGKMVEGIRFFSSRNEEVINFPKTHKAQGMTKNKSTSKRYKKVIRIFKRIKIQMEKENASIPRSISSFLISSLIWNVPDAVFTQNPSSKDTIRGILFYLRNQTEHANDVRRWTEVSGHLPLFSAGRKWSIPHTHIFLKEMWRFLEFE